MGRTSPYEWKWGKRSGRTFAISPNRLHKCNRDHRDCEGLVIREWESEVKRDKEDISGERTDCQKIRKVQNFIPVPPLPSWRTQKKKRSNSLAVGTGDTDCGNVITISRYKWVTLHWLLKGHHRNWRNSRLSMTLTLVTWKQQVFPRFKSLQWWWGVLKDHRMRRYLSIVETLASIEGSLVNSEKCFWQRQGLLLCHTFFPSSPPLDYTMHKQRAWSISCSCLLISDQVSPQRECVICKGGCVLRSRRTNHRIMTSTRPCKKKKISLWSSEGEVPIDRCLLSFASVTVRYDGQDMGERETRWVEK